MYKFHSTLQITTEACLKITPIGSILNSITVREEEALRYSGPLTEDMKLFTWKLKFFSQLPIRTFRTPMRANCRERSIINEDDKRQTWKIRFDTEP